MTERTPLHALHIAFGGRMTEFAGWELPLHFGSQLQEHRAVRASAGLFDVSHMTVTDLTGPEALSYLQILLANDVGRLKRPGQALYGCMLNDDGGVIDDLIVYRWSDTDFTIVSNAAPRIRVLGWMRSAAEGHDVAIVPRSGFAMIAVQGPKARSLAADCLDNALRDAATGLGRFEAARIGDWQISRTGYTGEDGFEIILPAPDAQDLWRRLAGEGIQPCGLGARDSLRLEAGLRLHGADMDETTSPLEAALAWTVAWEPAERSFIGRPALERQRAGGIARQLLGIVLTGKGMLRPHQRVAAEGLGEGRVTSASFSPRLNRSIGFVRLPTGPASRCRVEIRGAWQAATLTDTRFLRSA